MVQEIKYNKNIATEYATRWALDRNPEYMDFEKMGGDCTNFVSQCIFAGCNTMNFTPTYGWYYLSSDDRTPSWSGAAFLYNFLVNNKSVGAFGVDIGAENTSAGDIIQFGDEKDNFFHSVFVTKVDGNKILVCAHSVDSYMRPLYSYEFYKIRGIHILGARKSV